MAVRGNDDAIRCSCPFRVACGHTALASLPRLKAESPAQRTARIKYEKVAAAQRSCDFCPPVPEPSVGSSDVYGVGSVAAIPSVMQTMSGGIDNVPLDHAVTGDYVHESEQQEAMTMPSTEPVTEPVTAHDLAPATPETTPALIRPKGVFPLRKLSDEQEREVTCLYAETPTPRVEIGQTSMAGIAQRHGAPLRSPNHQPSDGFRQPGVHCIPWRRGYEPSE